MFGITLSQARRLALDCRSTRGGGFARRCRRATGGEARPARARDGGPTNLVITMLPKNLGNAYFDTSTGGAEEATAEFGGTFEEVGPSEASPTSQVQLHPDRRAAGRRGSDRLGERPRGAVRRARRGAATQA